MKITGNEKVSIIIPTYKENENIVPLVERLHQSLNSDKWEVLFVDDNSRDGTEETIKSLAVKYPVKLMVRINKKGLSSAVVDGIKATDGNKVLVMDADLQHPPEVVPDIVRSLDTNDLTVGSRYVKGGSPGAEWSVSRKVISTVANMLALPLAPKIKDRMTGFFGFRRAAVNPDMLNSVGWKIGLEVMVKGRFKSISEIPYTFAIREHGTSKLSQKIVGQYLKQLVMLYVNHYQVSNFMMVGAIGYLINIGLYSLLLLVPALKTGIVLPGNNQYLFPFVISSLVAITSNYTLNKIWTFRYYKENSFGAIRYLAMALSTLVLDISFLWLLVEIFSLPPIGAAAIAILIVFIIRYFIAKTWVWMRE